MIDWKIIIVFVGLAVLISLITGLFSGVAFLDVILRAFFWGILFGALGFGILALVNRFLPELTDIFSSNKPMREKRSGEEVDIVLPDENPHESHVDADFFDDMNAIDNDEGSEGNEGGEEIDDDEYNNEKISDEISEKISEEIPLEGAGEKSKNRAKPREEDLETLEEIGEDFFKETNELDNLPDLDKFSGSFSGFDDFDASTSESAVFKTKESVDISGVKQDPSKVAKAIHTWIERDKEG